MIVEMIAAFVAIERLLVAQKYSLANKETAS
jgi:hypothetical protein